MRASLELVNMESNSQQNEPRIWVLWRVQKHVTLNVRHALCCDACCLISILFWLICFHLNVNGVFTLPKCRWNFLVPGTTARTLYLAPYDYSHLAGLSLFGENNFCKVKENVHTSNCPNQPHDSTLILERFGGQMHWKIEVESSRGSLSTVEDSWIEALLLRIP